MSIEELVDFFCKSSERKPTKEEKRERRKELLKERLQNVTDKFVRETFEYIEARMPNYFLDVCLPIYTKSGDRIITEFDLVGRTAIIEVKSGMHSNWVKQLTVQKKLAEKRDARHILYAPNIRKVAKNELEIKGFTVYTNLPDLYKGVKNAKHKFNN